MILETSGRMAFLMEGEEKATKDPFAEPGQILKASDPWEVAERASVPFEENRFKVSLMLWDLYISHPDLDLEAPKFLDTYVIKLLTVIYLAKGEATVPANQWVPYRELKDGLFYAKSFGDTVEERVCRRFGEDLEGMRKACLALGGREVDQGDLGMVINTFPRLPLLLILWRGDEEFGPNARILFDASATHYFNAFELRMLCGEIVNRLIRIADGTLELP
jgi:Domain of unknown function (DUF3786)